MLPSAMPPKPEFVSLTGTMPSRAFELSITKTRMTSTRSKQVQELETLLLEA
jgi:hypothetical protein